MRKITLNKMRIENFKGIQNLEIDFDGENKLISGFNGVGKSTIADAYFWATTGKNMALSTRFEVRPRDEQGNEVHDAITSVECEFSVVQDNGDCFTFTIRRDECEDLTKKECEQLKPETIAPKKSFYFVDGAPLDAKIFYEKIAAFMCDKDKFTLLSNPFAFFALKEQEQRDLLTAACGEIADSEVEGYDKVKDICGAALAPTEQRDALKKTISSTQKRLEEIPARIDSLSALCDEFIDYDKQIAELEKRKGEVEVLGKASRDKWEELRTLKTIELPDNSEILKAQNEMLETRAKIAFLKSSMENLIRDKKQDTCPNCGYVLHDSAKHLESATVQLGDQNRLLAEQEKRLEIVQSEYDKAIAEFNAQSIDHNSVEQREKIQKQIDEYRKQYTDLSVEIEKLCQAKKVQAQIKQLRDEQRQLDNKLADSMTKFDIISAFILKKAESAVENINKRFKTVRVKLFEMQANGELKPCCKATVDGVSYANINTAKKVQVGIELANLFSDYLGVKCPIWIDNRESVIDIPQTDAQMICLKVDEQYKEINVEAM